MDVQSKKFSKEYPNYRNLYRGNESVFGGESVGRGTMCSPVFYAEWAGVENKKGLAPGESEMEQRQFAGQFQKLASGQNSVALCKIALPYDL